MRIALLDDDTIWMNKGKDALTMYAKASNLAISVFQFEDHAELLSSDEAPFDLVFVDIKLKEENGINVAKTINQLWKDCRVVYCTDYLYFATDVYETDHMYFVIKDQFEDRLDQIFGKLFAEWNKEEKSIIFRVIHGDITRFFLTDILYFERKGRKTLLVTKDSVFQIHEKISDIMPLLPNNEFSRCHTSFIINLSHVEKKDGYSFLMNNRTLIPISRTYRQSARDEYLQWCDKQMEWSRKSSF